ncbi:endolytic transglycosylase MltG [bacterium]|nr:endolytic transglycosylase MltG [bacterium]
MSDAPETTSTESPDNSPVVRARRHWLRRALTILFALLFVLAGAVAGSYVWIEDWAKAPFGQKASVNLTLARGMHTRAIGAQLKQAGLIDNDLLFLAWLRIHKLHSKIQAGRYAIATPISPADLLARLSHGAFERTLTIPEGWTVAQIGHRLKEQGWIADERIWADLASQPIPASVLGVELPRAEGFCFPETYQLEDGSRPESILARMLDRFRRQWQASRPDQRDPRARDLTLLQAVTLASMIEREARVPDEMPLMASVYLNRMHKGMRLQCDATVYYALNKNWDEPLRHADLEVDHPYNTYKRMGLPPGPISNPSQSALEAVLHPAANDFLFYFYAGDKRHIFSRTFAEHQAVIRAHRTPAAHHP